MEIRAIAGKHAQLEDFLRRLASAQRWEAAHKNEYAAVLAKETGLPLDVALYTVSQARGVTTPIDASVIAEERDTLNTYLRAGVIPSEQYLDRYVLFADPTYPNSQLVIVRSRDEGKEFAPVTLDCAGTLVVLCRAGVT